ncbi:MAG: cell division protein ZapE [Chromatiales bacterium]
MTPLERYRQDLQRHGFVADRAQKRAVRHTERLYRELVRAKPSLRPSSVLERLLRRRRSNIIKPVRGLYFWGGVGRGKTYVVDAFYDCLPHAEKARFHFHSFMRHIHHELKTLKEVTSPLEVVAERLARTTRVLCFDEFHVSDITDAMLLGNLLHALFERGVTLVATSNEHPDCLYWGGLQRERFLPAIQLIKTHVRVFHFDNDTDYRLRALERAEIYHTPLDDRAHASLRNSFDAIAPDAGEEGGHIDVEGRDIPAVRRADGVVWFDFEAICDGPRAAADYIEIGRCYQTVLISDIPRMHDLHNDAARRFIHLVDEFYDRNVKLIVSAAAPPAQLYCGEHLAKLYERTVSRLVEMQSHDYLARPHLSD